MNVAEVFLRERPANSSKREAANEPAPLADAEVARRAYDLYLARGCEPGHDVEDWLQAERDLRGAIDLTDDLRVCHGHD